MTRYRFLPVYFLFASLVRPARLDYILKSFYPTIPIFNDLYEKTFENIIREKQKLLVTSNFFFYHGVFKILILQTRKNQGLFGKGLKSICISFSPENLVDLISVNLERFSNKGVWFLLSRFGPFQSLPCAGHFLRRLDLSYLTHHRPDLI